MAHWVYILQSEKIDRFYIGYTANLDLRLGFHENADQRKFTYNADDWTIFLKIECQSKMQGVAIEKHIKSMKSKTYIVNLQKYPEMVSKLLQRFADC